MKNKYYYYLCTIITILCPIISEIILLLPIQNNTYPRVISGIVLGISSLVAALLPLFDFRKKWGIYRNQAEELKTILVEMSGNDGKNENDLLHKMEESVRETHENWMEPFKTDKGTEEGAAMGINKNLECHVSFTIERQLSRFSYGGFTEL